MQHLEKGVHRGWQTAIFAPDQAEIAFRLDINEWEDPQDTLLDFEGDGKAGYHGNAEPRHDCLLNPFTPLQYERVGLNQVRPVEYAFHRLPRG